MTLRESLTEHYITQPETMHRVSVNGEVTTDWERELCSGDEVEVDWPNVGVRIWTIGEPA